MLIKVKCLIWVKCKIFTLWNRKPKKQCQQSALLCYKLHYFLHLNAFIVFHLASFLTISVFRNNEQLKKNIMRQWGKSENTIKPSKLLKINKINKIILCNPSDLPPMPCRAQDHMQVNKTSLQPKTLNSIIRGTLVQ